jgi:hypothetical protein
MRLGLHVMAANSVRAGRLDSLDAHRHACRPSEAHLFTVPLAHLPRVRRLQDADALRARLDVAIRTNGAQQYADRHAHAAERCRAQCCTTPEGCLRTWRRGRALSQASRRKVPRALAACQLQLSPSCAAEADGHRAQATQRWRR